MKHHAWIVRQLTYESFRCVALFLACREPPQDRSTYGGWWCPVPPPSPGEDGSYITTCDHTPFCSDKSLAGHYAREHFDFGVISPRKIRHRGIVPLECPDCDHKEMRVESMDNHIKESRRCGTDILHPYGEIEISYDEFWLIPIIYENVLSIVCCLQVHIRSQEGKGEMDRMIVEGWQTGNVVERIVPQVH